MKSKTLSFEGDSIELQLDSFTRKSHKNSSRKWPKVLVKASGIVLCLDSGTTRASPYLLLEIEGYFQISRAAGAEFNSFYHRK